MGILSVFNPNVFSFTQAGMQVVSLASRPGMEFGLKAHNLGILADSHEFRDMTVPGAAIFTADPSGIPDEEKKAVFQRITHRLEKAVKRRLGASEGIPLLLAVRSSPQESAPGVAKSVIYVGMNEKTREALASSISPTTAWRTYAWFLRNYSMAVHPIESSDELFRHKPDGMAWEEYTGLLMHALAKGGIQPPDDPLEQLLSAYNAVADGMTAAEMSGGIIIQQAVVIDDHPLSGSGIYFTRYIDDGSPADNGRFAAQGDGASVVTGNAGAPLPFNSPILFNFSDIRKPLEKKFGDPLEIEFSSIQGNPIILQARRLVFPDPRIQKKVWDNMLANGTLSPSAYPHRIAMLKKWISPHVYVLADRRDPGKIIGKGTGVSNSFAAIGELVRIGDLKSWEKDAQPLILYVDDPSKQEVIKAVWKRQVAGVVTASGHKYSHVALLAASLKIPMIIDFSGDLKGVFGQPVLLDEVSGGLYLPDNNTAGMLITAPHTDPVNLYGINPEEIEKEVQEEFVGMSIGEMARMHDILIERSIQAARRNDTKEALRLTLEAHFYHLEIQRLEKTQSTVIYVWDHELSGEITRKLANLSPRETRIALINSAPDLDPTFKALSERYGGRLRLVVEAHTHAGGRSTMRNIAVPNLYKFYRISAILEGEDQSLMREAIPIPPFSHGGKESREVAAARERAQKLAERIKGATVLEYTIIYDYHDRGILSGKRVITVLPPPLEQ